MNFAILLPLKLFFVTFCAEGQDNQFLVGGTSNMYARLKSAIWCEFSEVMSLFARDNSSVAKADGPNKEVEKLLEEELKQKDATLQPASARGEYQHFTPKESAQVGKRAAGHGVTAAVRYFAKLFLCRSLKESTMRTWKKTYLQEMSMSEVPCEAMTVEVYT